MEEVQAEANRSFNRTRVECKCGRYYKWGNRYSPLIELE